MQDMVYEQLYRYDFAVTEFRQRSMHARHFRPLDEQHGRFEQREELSYRNGQSLQLSRIIYAIGSVFSIPAYVAKKYCTVQEHIQIASPWTMLSPRRKRVQVVIHGKFSQLVDRHQGVTDFMWLTRPRLIPMLQIGGKRPMKPG